jgi:hypothetical protein
MTDAEEKAYVQGKRRAVLSMIQHCARELGVDLSETVRVPWLVEREEAVQRLRDLCREFGDLDWPEHMHLADVIDKHLGNHLREAKTGRGR